MHGDYLRHGDYLHDDLPYEVIPPTLVSSKSPNAVRVPHVEGRKDDGAKDRWDLLPTDAVRQVVKVLTFGAGKYGDRNWEAGIKYSRVYAAALRHLTAWFEGENEDPETRLSHLAHAGCCVLFLLAYERSGGRGEFDDRPRSL